VQSGFSFLEVCQLGRFSGNRERPVHRLPQEAPVFCVATGELGPGTGASRPATRTAKDSEVPSDGCSCALCPLELSFGWAGRLVILRWQPKFCWLSVDSDFWDMRIMDGDFAWYCDILCWVPTLQILLRYALGWGCRGWDWQGSLALAHLLNLLSRTYLLPCII
jgi:hypothetical protein